MSTTVTLRQLNNRLSLLLVLIVSRSQISSQSFFSNSVFNKVHFMKKLLVLGALTLLAGCTAGMKDSFDCNATAQDSCMTMEEANQRASAQTSPFGKSQTLGGTTQKRAELPRLAPLATPIVPMTTTAPTRQVQPVKTKNPVAQASASSLGAVAHFAPPVKKWHPQCLSSLTPQHRGGLGGYGLSI
ncbi:hypothetical protein ABN197_16940 [Providencia alcalifaciens]|uniref:hypothetical protein n=1 Tax=Providencia alcalifaciens TaxID=126385 RepID=UPI0032DBBA16